ncbi:MAG: DUF615 domain-containing protein [Polyangiales bacterium]
MTGDPATPPVAKKLDTKDVGECSERRKSAGSEVPAVARRAVSESWCGVARKKSRLRSTTDEEEVVFETRSSDRAADRKDKAAMGRLVRSIARLSEKQRAKLGLDEALMVEIERLAKMPMKSAYGRQVRTITSAMRRLGLDEGQLQAAYDRTRKT